VATIQKNNKRGWSNFEVRELEKKIERLERRLK
jgi:hypothetical protein